MHIQYMIRVAQRLTVGIALIGLSACAAVVSGNDTTTTIDSDPFPAACLLEGVEFKTTLDTPKALEIPTSAAPLTVSCWKEGHFETKAVISTEANPWILGNALIGGGIGLIIDLASGSGVVLPSQVTVKLDPSVFPTAAARDAYFVERLAAEEDKWKKVMTKYSNNECGPTAASNGDCSPEPQAEILSSKETALQRVQLMSEQAIISIKPLAEIENIPREVVVPE